MAYQLTELAPLLTYLGEVLGRDLGEQGSSVASALLADRAVRWSGFNLW